jgi:hypothetical protein
MISISHAQLLSLPVSINGRIDEGKSRGGNPDEDYFRFHANKEESVAIEVAAARLGCLWTSRSASTDQTVNPR